MESWNVVFLVSYDCYYSVALPHGAMGWPEVCDCGVFLSYSPTYLVLFVCLI